MSIEGEEKNPHWIKIRKARMEHALFEEENAARHKEQMKLERVEADKVLVEAILAGYEAGLSQSAIGRAYKTKDYRTIKTFIDQAEARRSVMSRFESIDTHNGWEFSHIDSFGWRVYRNATREVDITFEHGRRKASENRQPIKPPAELEWAYAEIEAAEAEKIAEARKIEDARREGRPATPAIPADDPTDFEWEIE